MKNFILTMLLGIMSVFYSFADNVNINNVSKIIVKAPCRIIYGACDSTAISIVNKSSQYDIYYEITDSVMYIKSKYNVDYFNDINKNELPIVWVINKNNILPTIQTSRSFHISEPKQRFIKKSKTHRNETTEIAKN